MTNEEYDAKIEWLENQIEEIKQDNEDLEESILIYKSEAEDYNEALLDREVVSEKAFIAGFFSGEDKNSTLTKAWLNYKIEARI